jgi:hypothetical protein
MRFPRKLKPVTPSLDQRHFWHVWFAWKPVKIGTYWVWLERVYRKGMERWTHTHGHACPVIHSWTWEYDELPYIGKL